MKRIAFRNARLVDPANGLDIKGGLLVENGRIADVGPRLFNDAEPNDPEVIDCRGLVLRRLAVGMRAKEKEVDLLGMKGLYETSGDEGQ